MKFTTKRQLTNVRPTKEDEGPVLKFATGGGTVKVYSKAASIIGVSNGERIYFQEGALDEGQFPGKSQIFIAKGSVETGLGQKASYPSDKIRSYMNISSAELNKTGRSATFAGREVESDEIVVYTLGTDVVEDEGMTFRNLVLVKIVKSIKKTTSNKDNTVASSLSASAPTQPFTAVNAELEEEEEEEEEVEVEL